MKLPPPGFKQPIPDPSDRDTWYTETGFYARWTPPYDHPVYVPIDDSDVIEVELVEDHR